MPGFRMTSLTNILPPWMQQQFAAFYEDGCMAAAQPSCDLEMDGDSLTISSQAAGELESEGGLSAPAPSQTRTAPGEASMAMPPPGPGLQRGGGPFMPFAVVIPGILHICNNLLQDVDTQLTHWDVFWSELDNLSALLSDSIRLDRLRGTCFANGEPGKQMFEQEVQKPYMKRWGSICNFMRKSKLKLKPLRDSWCANRFNGKEVVVETNKNSHRSEVLRV